MSTTTVPASFFWGNLLWTSSGTVHATWALSPLPKPQTPTEAAIAEEAHALLYRSLPGRQVLIQGLLTWTDPVYIASHMLDGVDLERNPAWATEVDATIDMLMGEWLGQRRWYLTVPISAGPLWRLQSSGRSGLNRVMAAAGIAGEPPSAAEIGAYEPAAARLAADLPATFAPRPITPSENIWIHRHALLRHDLGDIDPQQAPELAEGLIGPKGRAAIGGFTLDPMAMTDLPRGLKSATAAMRAPFDRRVLKIQTDTGEESYQASAILSDLPSTGLRFPDYQFLGRIDDSAVPVDVMIRATVRTRNVAMQKNKRSIAQLNDQLGQVGEDNDNQASHLIRLYDAAAILSDYNTQLSRDTKEVEVEPVVAVTTAAPTFAEADAQARAMVKHFTRLTWARPPGAEQKLFNAALPGGRMDAQLNDYRQIGTAATAATAVPITSSEVGSDTGFILGKNISTGLRSVVLLDLFGAAKNGKSPAFVLGGEQGAGKSKTMKKACGHIVDRGGRMIGTDNSTTREWVTWAHSMAAADSGISVAVCDVATPETSIDPLRVLPARLAGPVMQDFLIVLLNLKAQDKLGRLVAKVLKPSYLRNNNITSSGALHRHLANECQLPGAEELASKIDVFADQETVGSLAAAIFDTDLPPIDLNARVVIIATSSVDIPGDQEIEHEHLYNNLTIDKIFGRALWALIAKMGYEVCFADSAVNAIFEVDEVHHLKSSREALAAISAFVRYGRKARAAFIGGTHDPLLDFADPTLRGLIKNRLMMRNTDPDMAERCAAFLVNPDKHPHEHADVTERIMGHSPTDPKTGKVDPQRLGEGTFMDTHGRLADIKVFAEAQPHRDEASNSTPPDEIVAA